MVFFFFYDKMANVELIEKINTKFGVSDGYILIQSYDNDILKMGNDVILYGKIVNFNLNLEDVVQKINETMGYEKSKTTLDTIYVTKKLGGVCKAYIIY